MWSVQPSKIYDEDSEEVVERGRHQVIHERAGVMARGVVYGNAVTIEQEYNYSGSPNGFGGAKQWAHVSVSISFQEHEEEKAAEFVEKLKAFIDKELPEPIDSDETLE